MHLHHSSVDIFDMHSRDQQHAAREVKKFILSKERNDWEWPPRPSSPGSSGANKAAASLPPSIRGHALVDAEVVGWRERYYGSSDDEAGSQDDRRGEDKADAAQDGSFKFENPDSVGSSLEQLRTRRKRRRKAKLEEELAWNEGLRSFIERRNAWTDARKREDHDTSALVVELALEAGTAIKESSAEAPSDDKLEHNADKPPQTEGQCEATVDSLNNGVSVLPDARDGEEGDTEEPLRENTRHSLRPPSAPVARPASRGRGGKRLSTPATLPGPIPDSDPVIPIPPPFIDPSNILRAAIKPKAYSSIYTQVVQSTRTPSVPIPLADMIRALVQGWKDSGEWPPKGTAAPTAPLSIRRLTRNGREEVIGKILDPGDEEERNRPRRKSDYRGDDGIGGHGISVPPGMSIGEGLLSNHSHLRRGVEGVKRVLRLSGSHEKHSSHGSEPGDGEGGAAAVS